MRDVSAPGPAAEHGPVSSSGRGLSPSGDCVFCQIAQGRERADIVHRDEEVVAFAPLNPVVPGHTLVVPFQHVSHFLESPMVSAETMRVASVVATKVARTLHPSPEGWNLITSAGDAATQTIRHLHLHLVPRRHGDCLKLPWSAE